MAAAVVDHFSGMRDLADALDELAERERAGEPTFLLCCLLLYAGVRGPDALIAEYIGEAYSYLDDLTGDDCLVFVPQLDDDGSASIEVAKRLHVPLGAMPCCVFFAPASDRFRAVVPIGHAVTKVGSDGLDLLMRTITQVVRDVADVPADKRATRLGEELEQELALSRSVHDSEAPPANPTSKVSAGASVVAALAAVAKLLGLGP